LNINLKDEKEKFYDVLQRTVYGYIGGLKSLSSGGRNLCSRSRDRLREHKKNKN